MFNGNLEQQSIATIADTHAMQMANLILSTNQQNNHLQQSPHSFYGSVPLNGCNNNTITNTNSPSTVDVQRMQQWFRHNDTSPYTSPLPSNAPSIGDISGISLFTDNTSTLTLNSHLSNNSRIIKTESFEAPTASKYLETFKTIFSGQDTMINSLLDNLASISSSQHYVAVVREQPIQILHLFIELIIRNATYLQQLNGNYSSSISSPNLTQRITHLLRIFYNTLSEIPDKSEARTEQMMASLLQFLLIQSSNIKFFSMGILRVLMHANEQLKKFVLDQRGLELILKIISENQNLRLLRQALRTLTTLIDSKQQIFAEHFVRLAGIDLIVTRIDAVQPSSDDLYPALLTLKLVSDIPTLACMELDRAVHLAIRGTLPPPIPQTTKPGGCISANAVDTFWRNIVNSLGFLRNVCALNEQSRSYLIRLDEGRTISHLVELAAQSFDLLFCSPSPSSSSSSPSTSTTNTNTTTSSSTPSNVEQLCCISSEVRKSHVEIGAKRRQMLNTMLDECLCLLALVNKEYNNNRQNCNKINGMANNNREQKFASKKLAEDERAMLLYQLILRLDRTEFHKSVLTSLRRILNSGISLPIESRGIKLAETLLKYLFSHNTQIHLTKIAVEVLIGLVCDQSKLHLSVITHLLGENYQPFKLLDIYSNNIDMYLAILKLIKESCQREVSK
ncbi:unnamed protein product [Meloidogyne enterolobii]|uniref:Uncharacterized protein n=1 Tax=Meloidogyne enterolobii TaxID=390850 RepID=A0ACB0ZK97_MELEN